MATRETFTHQQLSIELIEDEEAVLLQWRGRSDDREPGQFLVPLIVDALQRCGEGARPLVMDFTALEYMNSSSFSPLTRLLGRSSLGKNRVRLEYSRARAWQRLSFTALKAFETSDGRISVHGR
jgi:anti-anti-sigma regulatory factor